MMAQIKNEVLLKKMAARLKSVREKAGVTQEQFFNDTGIHLARIETGSSNITISTLDAICNYFNIPIEQFFKGF